MAVSSQSRRRNHGLSRPYAEANECSSAGEVLALYKEFLADSSIDENELLSGEKQLADLGIAGGEENGAIRNSLDGTRAGP